LACICHYCIIITIIITIIIIMADERGQGYTGPVVWEGPWARK